MSRRPALLALTLLTAFGSTSCSWIEGFGFARRSSRDVVVDEGESLAAKKGKAPQDNYYAVGAKKKSTGSDFLVTQLSRDLVPPFRYEVRAGFMDPDGALGSGSFFCTELDERTDTAARFFALCVQPAGNGLNPFVNVGVIGQGGGQQFVGPVFAETQVVDLAIEATVGPNEMTFYARPESDDPDAPYTEIASVPYSVEEPLFPTVGVVGLAKGNEVGFDRFAFPVNTPENITLSESADVANTIWEAADSLLAALNQLDGGGTDLESGRASLLAAKDGLAGIDDAIAALGTKEAKKAGKQMKSVPKRIDKLVKAVDKAIAKGKVPKSLFNKTLQLMKRVIVATDLLNPRP